MAALVLVFRHSAEWNDKLCSDMNIPRKKCTLFECQCIWQQSTILRTPFFTSSTRDGAVIFCGHASHTRRANAAPIFLNYLKTLNTGAASGMELTNSCSTVKCSTDWDNPAVDTLNVEYYWKKQTERILWYLHINLGVCRWTHTCFSSIHFNIFRLGLGYSCTWVVIPASVLSTQYWHLLTFLFSIVWPLQQTLLKMAMFHSS